MVYEDKLVESIEKITIQRPGISKEERLMSQNLNAASILNL